MNATEIVLLSGLGAAMSWGFSDYFAAHASKKLGPLISASLTNILGAQLYALIFFAFLSAGKPLHIAHTGVIFACAAGVFLALATVAFYKGLEKGPVSIVSPLGSLYPLVTTLFAVSVFGARLSVAQTVGIVLIVSGVMAASGLMNAKKAERKLHDGPRFALLAALFWGISFSLQAQATARLGWQFATLIDYEVLALVFILALPIIRAHETFNVQSVKTALTNKYVLLASAIGMAGLLFVSIGIAHDTSSGAVISALSATYPIITVFLALHHMKEEFKLVPLAGAFVGVVGVIILSIG